MQGDRAVRRRTLVCALFAMLVVAFGATTAVSEDFGNLVTADEAVESITQADSNVLAEDTPAEGEETATSVKATESGFEATGTQPDVTLSKEAEDPISVETQSGDLEVTPVGTSPAAGDGEVVNEDVVVYPNTGTDSDTAVRPTENGVETFTGIRSEEAAEDFSFKVDLDGEEKLEKTDDGGVAIIDTDADPAAAYEGEKPADVAAGTDRADELKAADPAATSASDARPDAATDAATAAEDIRPVDDPAKVEQAADSGALEAPAGEKPAGEPAAGSGEGAEQAADAAVEAAVAEAKAEATDELGELRQEAARSNAVIDEAAEQTDEDASEVVVATIKPTWAKDADGDAVETSLSVEGDTVTMHVEHQDEDVAYPIVADPWVEVQRWYVGISHWRPVWRHETYLSHWGVGTAHVNWAHPAQCWNGRRCHYWGNGWHSIGHVFTRFEHGWNWAATYTFYTYPIYAQRWVIAHWEPVYAWMSYTDYEYRDHVSYDPATDSDFASAYAPASELDEPVAYAAGGPNGCGPAAWYGKHVPDAIKGVFNFRRSCDGHDICYARQRGKEFCDRGFRKAMFRYCGKRFPELKQAVKYLACRAAANIYYGAVRDFGQSAYDNA